MVSVGKIKVNGIIDRFVPVSKEASSGTNLLSGKKVVLLFGQSDHHLTSNFLVPKMAFIYHYITLQRNDIYVPLPHETEASCAKFCQKQRKCQTAARLCGLCM